jgi:hypothetical protein
MKPRKALPPRSKPLARGTVRLKRTAVKPAKPKGRARPDERLAVWCEAAIPDVCLGRATHRHHVRMRSHGDDDSRENTIDVCGAGGCHDFIHLHPAMSYENGWLKHG